MYRCKKRNLSLSLSRKKFLASKIISMEVDLFKQEKLTHTLYLAKKKKEKTGEKYPFGYVVTNPELKENHVETVGWSRALVAQPSGQYQRRRPVFERNKCLDQF